MTGRLRAPTDASALVREAAAALADAGRQIGVPSARPRHRELLERGIHLARVALESADASPGTITAARDTLVRAHAARAQDACHGAGQLSRSAQRAPTREACDEGWRRVDRIARGAEASAREAARLVLHADDPALASVERCARAAAREARRVVEERNHAYTFHSDPGFSFGEGWYLAAAAALAGVAIQIEPGKAQVPQAERFLRDAGLAHRLVPYRSRPRANKQLPEIVAQAFRADPFAAQRALRAAFLGDAATPRPVAAWADRALAGARSPTKVLLWVRQSAYHPWRNTHHGELLELVERSRAAGLAPVLVGDALDGAPPSEAVDLTLFWKQPLFQGADMRRAQLQLFEHLKGVHGLVGQIGVTTAGMDGPALMGLPTLFLTDAPNVRMGAWIGVVPGYRGLVRGERTLDDVSESLRAWAQREADSPDYAGDVS